MGPQLVSCGCVDPLPARSKTLDASMGPQLVSCGCAELNNALIGAT